jgi:hypothetical protein
MQHNFSHLVVNGCSFTVCEGLEYPEEQGWPKIVADKLGIPLINLAQGGAGNDRILRTTTEYIYQNPLPNPLYIIAFSQSSRREEYFKIRGNHELHDYAQIYLTRSIGIRRIPGMQFFADQYDQLIYSQRKIMFWLHLLNTLKMNNLSYLTTDFIPDHEYEIEDIKKHGYQNLVDAITNDPNRITNFEYITRGLPKLPCGHESLPTMQIIADYAYEEIQKRWL